MLLPIRTSISPRRTPYANYILITTNIVIFMLSYWPHQVGPYIEPLRNWAQPFMLLPEHPYIWQFVTYAFLHGSLMHILGNMYFLYIFGNNVNDRLGNVGYICFYLGGAVFSGLGHALLHSNPVLGASGAVAAVTGAYLVLFPHTFLTVIYMFIIIGTFEIKAMFLIAIKLILFDNFLQKHISTANIAFDAHLAGYGFGIIVLMGLLAVKILDSSYADLWGSLRQWNRRRRFRDIAADDYDPWGHRVGRKPVTAKVEDSGKADPNVERILGLRAQIGQAMNRHDNQQAARLYEELLDLDPRQVLPRQLQLDMANQLFSDGKWKLSSKTYELFLASYSNYEHAEQVFLMLGLLYGRYLNQRDIALDYLNRAKDRLTDPGQKSLCTQEISRLENA
ncbi:MAG: rhomboid family intramembrane serine protease [Phycisphaerae bacterium]|nr:rhomboid family intramembrane serine protease [Phycisphaerae bacterium]